MRAYSKIWQKKKKEVLQLIIITFQNIFLQKISITHGDIRGEKWNIVKNFELSVFGKFLVCFFLPKVERMTFKIETNFLNNCE